MKGGVRKRGATWSYYFYIGKVDGKKKMKEKSGFKNKTEAEKALRNALYEFENGGYISPKKITLLQFSLDWLENYVKPMRKITTYNRYNELLKKYILNTIGNLNIIDVESFHIEQLLLDVKKKKNISNATLQSIYTILNTIFNRALKLKLIKDNPCKYIERPKRDKFIPDVLTIDEIPLIVNALNLNDEYDYMFYIAFKITLELGLRRGELGGLEWSNVDFKENAVTIKNNLIYTNGYVKMTTPKTLESCRNIYISDALLQILKSLRKIQNENKLKYGEFYEENIFEDEKFDLIMKWFNGKNIHPMFYPKKLKKILNTINIDKNIRWHDLRHTNATLLLSQGIDFKVIQERLGHSDIGTTMNIYSHVNKDMQKDATEKLNNLLNF